MYKTFKTMEKRRFKDANIQNVRVEEKYMDMNKTWTTMKE
jgi:hypothetical protein